MRGAACAVFCTVSVLPGLPLAEQLLDCRAIGTLFEQLSSRAKIEQMPSKTTTIEQMPSKVPSKTTKSRANAEQNDQKPSKTTKIEKMSSKTTKIVILRCYVCIRL